MCTPPALAQRPRPDRSYRGLFGGNGANPNSTQQLDLSISLFGAYDDNVLTQEGLEVDPRFQQSGGYGAGTLSVDFTKTTRRVTFDLTGGTSYHYYQSIDELNAFNWGASLGLTVKLSPSTELRMTESGSYSPFYSFVGSADVPPPVPGQIAPINPVYPLAEEPAVSAYSSASIQRRLTPRSSLSGDYTFSYMDYTSRDLPYRNWRAAARYNHSMSSRANLNVTYYFERGYSALYHESQSIDSHSIEVGFSYIRRLSPSRTMTLGFSIGPSAYQGFVPVGDPANEEWQRTTQYPVRGGAFLAFQIARSWSAGVNYSRQMQYTPGFTDPFFTDSVTARLTGFLTERARLTFSGRYDTGSAGYGIAGRRYDTATANASYQLALTRWAALFANYAYCHYLFDESVPLPEALARGQNRNSISVGMSLWTPLLR